MCLIKVYKSQISAIYSLNLDLVANTTRLQLDDQETNFSNTNDTTLREPADVILPAPSSAPLAAMPFWPISPRHFPFLLVGPFHINCLLSY